MSARLIVLALSLVLFVVPSAVAAPATVTEDGYLEMSDGVRLRYHLVRPDDSQRHPVVVQYDGYSAGTDPTFGSIPKLEARLLDRGFALLGVSIRGTGCSSGIHDLFEPRQARDGAEAVEWAASQRWSNGRVGMAGYSFPGIMQLLTAAERPRGLRAIVPSSVVFDLYRDVAYPGGIANTAFGVLFTEQQKLPSQQETPRVVAGGDGECAANYAAHEASNPVIAQQQTEAPFSDSAFGGKTYAQRSPASTAARIDVPVLTSIYWQDEQTGSRVGGLLEPGGLLRTLDRDRTWAMLSNGNHDFNESNPVYLDMMEAFLAHFVGGDDNGFARTPKITQLHETSYSDRRGAWVSRFDSLPAVSPLPLSLSGDGRLLTNNDVGKDEQAFDAPAPSSSTSPAPQDASGDGVWAAPVPVSGRAVWTSPRLGSDLEVLGSASLDLRVVAERSDVDLQATITEVRADGQEHYVQRGWLRASQRALDPARSTATRPFHPMRGSDARPVVPGEPFSARVEVFPFGHTFRAGSAIRVVVDSPTGVTGNWGFSFRPDPQRVRILGGSRLVLGRIPGEARARPRACGDLRSLPCRDSIAPVPDGVLRLPALDGGSSSVPPVARRCVSRRGVTITLPRRFGRRPARLRVTVNGRGVRAKRRGRRVTVSFTGRPRETVTVRLRARTARGRTVRDTRRYRLCRVRAPRP